VPAGGCRPEVPTLGKLGGPEVGAVEHQNAPLNSLRRGASRALTADQQEEGGEARRLHKQN
jgi:hypothetical protein